MSIAPTAAVHQYLRDHEDDSLQTLFTLLRQPSISAQDRGVKECAGLLAGIMRERGIETEVVPTPTQPVVFGQIGHDPSRPTLICYGHYDVQPPEPLELWNSPPFEPTVRDGVIYARGAGDNKGQLIAHVLAAGAWRRTAGEPPVNVRFVFEGEEESGSRSLGWFIERNRERLRDAALVYVSDGGMHPSGRPVINLGNRGIQGITLIAQGADRDNHSGNKGGVAPNPVWMLVHVLASMVAPDGRITIDGFHDGVRPVGAAERAMIEALPFDPVAVGATMGLPRVDLDRETYYRRIMLEPYFNISGIASGYVGEGSKTIIPATAECRIDIRLVADQSAADILEKVRAHVARVDPRVQVLARGFGTMEPHRTPADHPGVAVVARAVQAVRGVAPLVEPSAGGSLPNAVWPRLLGVSVLDVPYANADENNHSPNENIRLDRFLDGVHISAQVFAELANS